MNHRGVVYALEVLMAMGGMLIGGSTIARAQDSPHGRLSFACEECHSPDTWKEMPRPAKFDHARTGFVLKGQHAEVACMDCHTALTFKFKKSSTRCADCHKDVHNNELGATCDRCHNVQSWLVPDMIQKHSATRFSLVGMHATVPCQECHVNEQKHEYVGLRTDCYGCHQRDYDGTTAPNHRASGLGTDCQSCHAVNAMNWQNVNFTTGGTFDHSKTGFALAGAHLAVTCQQCHTRNRYAGISTQCYSCHQQQFTTASNPPHQAFPMDCTTCHGNMGWIPATFDHSKTAFPLTGAHATVLCAQCHVNNNYSGSLPTDCYSCHQADFVNAMTPVPHTGFPTTCTSCHTTNPGWTPSTYSHANASPRFPQDSRHLNAGCAKCHQTATNYTVICCQNSGCHNSCAGGD